MTDYSDTTRADERAAPPPASVDAGVPLDADETDETLDIREDIEQTRADLSETINAIQERLNPQTLVEQAKDSVRETATDMVDHAKETVRDATIGKAEQMVSSAGETARGTGSSMMETIRQNPLPAALAAIGVGWLWINRAKGASDSKGSSQSYQSYRPSYQSAGSYNTPGTSYGAPYGASAAYQTVRRGSGSYDEGQGAVGDAVSTVQDKAGQLAGQAQSGVSQLADQAQSGVSQLAGQAQSSTTSLVAGTQQQAQRAQGQLQQMLQETPLAVGGIALALGAAVGLAIPETPPENHLMGEARDTLMQKAQATAQDTMHKVQDVAQKAGGAAIDTAKDEAQTGGLALS